jgi:putative ABC transport system permease protein
MHWNYFKIAFRNLYKQLAYTLINVVGLSTGIAAFLLIMLFVQYHFSFDKHIPEADRCYRLIQIQQAEGVGEQHVAFNPGPMAPELPRSIPEIEYGVRMLNWGTVQIRVDDAFYAQDNAYYTDSVAFDVFGIQLIIGNPMEALKNINSIVISETVAKKLFGSAEKAFGQTISLNYSNGYLITGIMQDQPATAHLQLEVLISYQSIENQYEYLRSWDSNSMPVYVRLKEQANPAIVGQKITQLLEDNKDYDFFDESPKIYLQPLNDIHSGSGHIKFQLNHFPVNLNLLLAILITALIIIAIACINFINLAIARSVKRAKEVGVRKTLGASRLNLVYQFIGESMIITFISIILALLIVELSLPKFNQLLNTELKLSFYTNPLFNTGLISIWAGISLFSGFYPAFYMSRYQAVEVLKGIRNTGSKFGGLLSKALVVFQFTMAIGLTFIVLVTYRQIQFIGNKDLGYNYKHVIGLMIPGPDVKANGQILKQEIKNLNGIINTALASDINGVAGSQTTIEVADTTNTRMMTRMGYVDEDFFDLMEIPVILGRNFEKSFKTDEIEAVILNQAAINALGWDEPLGKKFKAFGNDTLPARTVVGVISDYHYYSIHSRIEPAAFYLRRDGYNMVCIKHNRSDLEAFKTDLKIKWQELFPGNPFQLVTAEERLEREYRSDRYSLQLFTMFTILALLISGLGLYGLTALRVEQRSREVAIRKVLGGNLLQMMLLIAKEFLFLLIFATILSLPIAWLLSNQLLSYFAYAISISAVEPILAVGIALLIALFTISFHARRIAVNNPINALKTE